MFGVINFSKLLPLAARPLTRAAALLALALCLGSLSGCGKGFETAATPNPKTEETEAPWDWNKYPLTTRIHLATLAATLSPRNTVTVRAPVSGTLQLRVTNTQVRLPAEFVWGEFEARTLEQERQAIDFAERKLVEREKRVYELDIPRERIRLFSEIQTADRDVKTLEIYSDNPKLARAALKLDDVGRNPFDPEVMKTAREKLRLLELQRGYLETTNLAAMGIDLESEKIGLEQRWIEFERRLERSRLIMPFDGQLTLFLNISAGLASYPITAEQEVAVIRDFSRIYVRLKLDDPAWVGLPGESLSAAVRLPDGRMIFAKYAFDRVEVIRKRDTSVHYFELPDSELSAVAHLMGSRMVCDLWLEIPEPARLTPKLKLLLHARDSNTGGDWNQLVARHLPGAKVVAQAQTHLAIIPPADSPPAPEAETTK